MIAARQNDQRRVEKNLVTFGVGEGAGRNLQDKRLTLVDKSVSQRRRQCGRIIDRQQRQVHRQCNAGPAAVGGGYPERERRARQRIGVLRGARKRHRIRVELYPRGQGPGLAAHDLLGRESQRIAQVGVRKIVAERDRIQGLAFRDRQRRRGVGGVHQDRRVIDPQQIQLNVNARCVVRKVDRRDPQGERLRRIAAVGIEHRAVGFSGCAAELSGGFVKMTARVEPRRQGRDGWLSVDDNHALNRIAQDVAGVGVGKILGKRLFEENVFGGAQARCGTANGCQDGTGH